MSNIWEGISNIWGMLGTMVTVPLWYLAAAIVGSVLISFGIFVLADYLISRRSHRRGNQHHVSSRDSKISSLPNPSKTTDSPLPPAPSVTATVLPLRQYYWYYVSGVAGRFATLRDALAASGANVPDDKMLDWKKLTSDTRARIKRVKVGEEQPVLEPLIVKTVSVPEKTAVITSKDNAESVIKKSIGNGCFVLIKKKGK